MQQFITLLLTFISVVTEILTFVIVIRVIFSWFPVSHNRFVSFVYEVTNPIFNLIKPITPRLGMFDLSPFIAYFAVQLAGKVLSNVIIYFSAFFQ